MTALYPTLSVEGKPLYRVTGATGNTRSSPLSTTIAAAGFTESIGFNGIGLIMQIEALEVTGGGDNVIIQTSKTADFAQSETLLTEAFASKAIGDVLTVEIEPNVGFVRVSNTSTGAVAVRYWRRPSKLSA